uniref:Uncharacterized protein n=1 Tax=Branchiostoma floridae TaxID=7739 RepID=C3XS54_BRAFL|eukprot:XP_002613513.1 hypothetical protein BRAFLDRAFT_71874 [Branchiostoma floridae]
MAGVLRGSFSRLLQTTNALPIMKAGIRSEPAKNVLTKSAMTRCWVSCVPVDGLVVVSRTPPHMLQGSQHRRCVLCGSVDRWTNHAGGDRCHPSLGHLQHPKMESRAQEMKLAWRTKPGPGMKMVTCDDASAESSLV